MKVEMEKLAEAYEIARDEGLDDDAILKVLITVAQHAKHGANGVQNGHANEFVPTEAELQARNEILAMVPNKPEKPMPSPEFMLRICQKYWIEDVKPLDDPDVEPMMLTVQEIYEINGFVMPKNSRSLSMWLSKQPDTIQVGTRDQLYLFAKRGKLGKGQTHPGDC